MLESQSGLHAARVFTALPTSPEFRLQPPALRVLLLRRLRLPLPLDAAICWCHCRLDVLGDHRAGCPRSGLLRTRGLLLERAAPVCKEAAVAVACNVFLPRPQSPSAAAGRAAHRSHNQRLAMVEGAVQLLIPCSCLLSSFEACPDGIAVSLWAPLRLWAREGADVARTSPRSSVLRAGALTGEPPRLHSRPRPSLNVCRLGQCS